MQYKMFIKDLSNHYQNVSKEYFTSTTAVWQLSKSLEVMLNEKVSMLQVGYERIASTIPNEEDLLIEVEEDSSTTTEEHRGNTIPTWSAYNSLLANDDIRFLTNTLYFPLIPAPSSNLRVHSVKGITINNGVCKQCLLKNCGNIRFGSI